MAKVRNASISVANFGERKITVGTVDHNIKILNDGSVYTRTGRAMYVKIATSGSFSISVIVTSHAERDDLQTWLGLWVRQAGAGVLGPARVRIPSIGFDRVGMIESAIPRGRKVGDYVWRISMEFIGARDLLDLGTTDVTKLSGFVSAEMQATIRKEPSVQYFYPGGTQLQGRAGGVDEYVYGGATPIYTSPRQAERASGTDSFQTPRTYRGLQP